MHSTFNLVHTSLERRGLALVNLRRENYQGHPFRESCGIEMMQTIDGFYSVFLSGKSDNGFCMLIMRKGKIIGADVLGATYDGSIELTEGELEVTMNVRLLPYMPRIQGGVSGPFGESEEIIFRLPIDFASRNFVRIDTKRGPINAKLIRIRGIDA
jgi:hypothetical protein